MNKILLILLSSLLLSNIIKEGDYLVNLQKGEIDIGYKPSNPTWCYGNMTINYSLDQILSVVEDVENYYKFFDSLSSTKINKDDEVYIRIDMPFPFTDRDYTVLFDKIIEEKETIYSYKAIQSKEYPIKSDCIRLTEAEGEWILRKINDNKTFVRYTWNGDMKGDFPSWAYESAWIQQGNEILSCLSKEVERRYK